MRGATATWILLALTAASARAADAELVALESAVSRAVAKAEPSIACILVSRSPSYKQYEPAQAAGDVPGQLGRFDFPRALRDRLPSDLDNPEIRLLRSLDLSLPTTTPESYGSGVVIDAAARLVLTNAHVVRNAVKVYVRLPATADAPGSRGSWADIYASDPRSDLAVLRLQDPVRGGLQAIALGDGGRLRKGQFVIGLANPFAAGFRDGSPSASWGIVSNLRRRSPGNVAEIERARMTIHQFGTLVQTDVRLNIGCSGGALLNLDGELVGLTTALAALTGAEAPGGYALPMDDSMRRIIEVLRQGREVEYGFLGVTLVEDTFKGQGAFIREVSRGSPADRAGLMDGDCIKSINGMPVRENDDLLLLVGTQLAGGVAKVQVSRGPNGVRTTRDVKLAKFYVPNPPLASQRPPARRGLRVDYTSVVSQRAAVRQTIPDGVLIREVKPGSPAESARLQTDKVILQVNDQPVTTPTEFYAAMEKADKAPASPVVLTVLQSDGSLERVVLEPDAR